MCVLFNLFSFILNSINYLLFQSFNFLKLFCCNLALCLQIYPIEFNRDYKTDK